MIQKIDLDDVTLADLASGDIIEAQHPTLPDHHVRGEARSSFGWKLVVGDTFMSLTSGGTLDGWKLTRIRKAPPTVPTEPGLYLDTDGDSWHLDSSGHWWYFDGSAWADGMQEPDAKRYVPFRRVGA